MRILANLKLGSILIHFCKPINIKGPAVLLSVLTYHSLLRQLNKIVTYHKILGAEQISNHVQMNVVPNDLPQ